MASGSWKAVYNAQPFADSPCSEEMVKLFFEKMKTKSPEEQYIIIHDLEMGKIFGYMNRLIRSVILEN